MDTWGLYLVAAAFGFTGIGLLMAALGLPRTLRSDGGKATFGHSWLLSRLGTEKEVLIGTILWGLAGLGFIIAGAGMALQVSWWAWGAWLGAPLTIVAIVLWFGAIPSGTYAAGVLAALTIGALLFYLR